MVRKTMGNNGCPRKLVVVGGGFVGLHTAVHAAKKGIEVVVIDISDDIVRRINSGKKDYLHVREPYILENWDHVKNKIYATTSYSEAAKAHNFIIAVQTPRKGDRIDYSPLLSVAKSLAPHLKPGSLIVSEVTIYPGGTMELLAKPLSELTGYKLDEELFVAHVPERINAGSRKWTPENIPRVVGGIGPKSLEAAIRLYRDCLGAPIYPVKDIRIAETSKLLENSFRLLNISFLNELKRSFDKIGLDIKEVVKAASTKPFGFMPFYPGPYAGGACLPKDAFMLETKTGSLLLRIARYINETQPLYYAALLLKKIRPHNAKRILFYGLGFKPDSPYPIESPVLRVIDELRQLDPGLEIKRYDPLIPRLSDFSSEKEAIEWADLVVRWGHKNRKINTKIIELEDL